MSRFMKSVAMLVFVSGAAVVLLGASTAQSSQDDQKTASAAPTAPATTLAPEGDSSCLTDPAVLNEISAKKQQIEQKEKDIAARETELKAREAALGDEMRKLQDLRDEITGLQSARKKENADKVAKVVATLEGMSPKSAAAMLTTLDDGLAVAAISQMSTAKLAKVMNVIDTRRAARLTELLAGVVRAKDSSVESDASNGAAVATNSMNGKKGGKSNDKQPESIISGGPEQFAGRGSQSTGQGAVGGQ